METLVRSTIAGYALALIHPQPAVEVVTTDDRPAAHSRTPADVLLGQIYAPLTLLLSLAVGTIFVPQLLIEEKERHTLRTLMVTPASFEDVLLGKLLVVLAYQLAVTCAVLAIQGSLTGRVGLVLLYVLSRGLLCRGIGVALRHNLSHRGRRHSRRGLRQPLPSSSAESSSARRA